MYRQASQWDISKVCNLLKGMLINNGANDFKNQGVRPKMHVCKKQNGLKVQQNCSSKTVKIR